ncbi:hypothetical protein ACTWP6_19610 [Mycobacterium sp. 4D054]|uniref:hypothetical protein n=1 Tax=unclassified Mycobacterium TaxID=2642494 RepID=UPI0021B26753|nr:hypothetical protein [Mycobacterium sp. SMC-8]UXA11286.1 hypothetical protein KXD97_25110 [Mycobacterium sp. SMC-8]
MTYLTTTHVPQSARQTPAAAAAALDGSKARRRHRAERAGYLEDALLARMMYRL